MTVSNVSGASVQSASRKYIVYLIVVALAGWALASYDSNLLVLVMPNIAASLHLSDTLVGLLGFVIFAAEFVVTLVVGAAMDHVGRKRLFQISLVGAAVFTGLTYFANNFVELAVIRALAQGFAASEQAIAIALVSEQLPPKVRGFLYSIVQAGWPVGVFLASWVFLGFGKYGWHIVFLWGVLPLAFVIVSRWWVKEPERFVHLQKVKKALRQGRDEEVARLLQEYPVDIEEMKVHESTWRQLFATKGYVRRQVTLLAIIFTAYTVAVVPVGIYITYWLTQYDHWTGTQAGQLLLVSSGFGFLFYLIGGALGEKFGRKTILAITGSTVAPLCLIFLLVHNHTAQAIVYFLIYQAVNGTWSGTGFAYWGESFPTRIRGTAVGFLGAMIPFGLVIGSLAWTALISSVGPTWTWIILAVFIPLIQWLAWILPKIKPGTVLEDIAQ